MATAANASWTDTAVRRYSAVDVSVAVAVPDGLITPIVRDAGGKGLAAISPPQGCILAVGAGAQRPVVKDGALAVATVMTCTLSIDHRAVDGATGARFLGAFKKLIEDPLTMLL